MFICVDIVSAICVFVHFPNHLQSFWNIFKSYSVWLCFFAAFISESKTHICLMNCRQRSMNTYPINGVFRFRKPFNLRFILFVVCWSCCCDCDCIGDLLLCCTYSCCACCCCCCSIACTCCNLLHDLAFRKQCIQKRRKIMKTEKLVEKLAVKNSFNVCYPNTIMSEIWYLSKKK